MVNRPATNPREALPYEVPPSGRTPQGSCLEVAITGSKGYETGVTARVTPVLPFCLWILGAKSDARYKCGQQKTRSTKGEFVKPSLTAGNQELCL